MKLIITEKPSVAKSIASALGVTTYDGTIVLADTGGKYVNYRIEK